MQLIAVRRTRGIYNSMTTYLENIRNTTQMITNISANPASTPIIAGSTGPSDFPVSKKLLKLSRNKKLKTHFCIMLVIFIVDSD